MVRASLITLWRRRLLACQERLQDQPSALTWPHRVYAKVLSFLLACYGDEEIVDADDMAAKSSVRRAGTLRVPEHFDGTPPKSSERIRAALDHIHQACQQPPQGPLAQGVPEGHLITLRSFTASNRLISPAIFARKLQRRLTAQGISSEMLRQGRTVLVQVARADFERIGEQQQETYSSPFIARFVRQHSFRQQICSARHLVGWLIALNLSVCAVARANQPAVSAVVVLMAIVMPILLYVQQVRRVRQESIQAGRKHSS